MALQNRSWAFWKVWRGTMPLSNPRIICLCTIFFKLDRLYLSFKSLEDSEKQDCFVAFNFSSYPGGFDVDWSLTPTIPKIPTLSLQLSLKQFCSWLVVCTVLSLIFDKLTGQTSIWPIQIEHQQRKRSENFYLTFGPFYKILCKINQLDLTLF